MNFHNSDFEKIKRIYETTDSNGSFYLYNFNIKSQMIWITF
jgi:hypothetical protein